MKYQYLFYITFHDHLGIATYGPYSRQAEAMEGAKQTAGGIKFNAEKGKAYFHALNLNTLAMRTDEIKAETFKNTNPVSDTGNEVKS